MAKESGITTIITVEDSTPTVRTISNDIGDWSFGTPRSPQDVTGQDKAAIERLMLLADFSCTFTGFFNDASNLSFDVFKTIISSNQSRATVITISGQIMTAEVFYTDFGFTRGQDGSLGWTTPGVLANGTAPVWST